MIDKQSSCTLKVAALLTFIGGFLEIYSFLAKGGVFATVVTGNLVLLFHNLSSASFGNILKYIFPIIGFSLGIYLSIKIKAKFNSFLHWREYVILLEILLIIILYFLQSDVFELISVTMISFISGIQIQSFKKVENAVYMSTMCTGNTKKLVESLINKDKSHIKIFSVIVLFFVLGVIVGSILTKIFYASSILFLLIPYIIVYILVHKNI